MMIDSMNNYRVAVLIPCYNEHNTIVKVINDFHRELPQAEIIVFDNNCTDGSGDLARKAGAITIREKRQGKGFVVSAMMKKIEADIYVMVDGDDTYPAESVHELIQPILDEEADMVVGHRLENYSQNAFRPLHYTGNKIICKIINLVFSSNLKDPMSGYRVFTNEVADELPIVAYGFDVETEMTLQLLYRKFVIKERSIDYRERPHGSTSKLNTFRDGLKILLKIFSIMRAYKPLTFFGGLGLFFVFIGMIISLSMINSSMIFQDVFVVFKGIGAIVLIVVGIISGTIGIILHTLNFRLLELSSINSKLLYRIQFSGIKSDSHQDRS